MCLFGYHQMGGDIRQRWHTPVLYCNGRQVGQQFLRPSHHLLEVQVSPHEEDGIGRMIKTGGERLGILTAKALQPFGIAQYVTPQRVTAENQVLEIVEYQFGRCVLVALYLVNDYLGLLLQLVGWKGGVEDNIGQQLESTTEMLGQKGRVDNRLLLVGVGVQVAPYRLHAVQDVPCFPLVCSLKDEMLHKVCHTWFVGQFVARTCVDGKAAIGHLRARGLMDDAQPVGQGMEVAADRCIFKNLHSDGSIQITAAKIQQKLLSFMENCRYLQLPMYRWGNALMRQCNPRTNVGTVVNEL